MRIEPNSFTAIPCCPIRPPNRSGGHRPAVRALARRFNHAKISRRSFPRGGRRAGMEGTTARSRSGATGAPPVSRRRLDGAHRRGADNHCLVPPGPCRAAAASPTNRPAEGHGPLETRPSTPRSSLRPGQLHTKPPAPPCMFQFFIELTSSIFSVPRFLKTVRMIASPTAASAAATTITKKLKM